MQITEPNEKNVERATAPQFSGEASDDVRAWEEVDVGRYMPRRIRGSFKGRALG